IAAPQQRPENLESMRARNSPADGPNSRDESKPICGQDEDEDGGKKPESPFHQAGADNAFQKLVESLYHPFQEVLGARRRELHLASGITGEENEAEPNR